MKNQRFHHGHFWILLFLAGILSLGGCATAPDLVGHAANTPKYYSENKVFYLARLPEDQQHTADLVPLKHIYQVNTASREADIINHNNPLSVILQGVRLPENLPGGTRDIAVVLDVHTSGDQGLMTLLAFYQRDVPPGQMLNFNNLLVYADPMWDSSNPPYFRLRVLDVKAERNKSTEALLSKISNLSAEIGGMVPHPAIPAVTAAIDVASLILSNQRNVMLLDYQIQFYNLNQISNAGGAALGPLLAGSWLAVGRIKEGKSDFWQKQLTLERKTDRLVIANESKEGATVMPVPVPYVSVALVKADAEVPKLVLDRSAELLSLLSTPSGKSDVDALESSAESLKSAIDAFTVERRLRKYRSVQDIQGLIDKLGNADKLNEHETRRLMYVLEAITPEDVRTGKSIPNDWITWWNTNARDGILIPDATMPLGIIWRQNQQ